MNKFDNVISSVISFIRKQLNRRLHLNLPVSFAIIAIAAVAITFFSLIIQPISYSDMMLCLRKARYLILLLNLLPILLLSLSIFFISNNLIISVGLTGVFVFVISIINRVKIDLRQVPLYLSDFSLIREVAAISSSLDESIFLYSFLSLFAIIVLIALLCVFIKNRKMKLYTRIGGLAVFFTAFIILSSTVYSDKKLFNSFYVIKSDNDNPIRNSNSKGLIYSMIFTQNTMKVTKPKGYQAKDASDFLREYKQSAQIADSSKIKPDILIIMSESFSDLASSDQFVFTDYTYPLKNFEQLQNSSVSGHIVVPSFGGGTSESEFDVITGINSRLFRNGYPAYSIVKKNVSSTAWQLCKLGYYAEGIHPGEPWFYGRMNAFKLLGFEKFLDVSSFDSAKKIGLFMSENETMRVYKENYSDFITNNPGTPYYSFMVTIQNHGGYTNKYGAEKNFESSLDLNDSETNQLSNYFKGVIDCDNELQSLLEYLNNVSRPVVLVYFGDHYPLLDSTFYDKFFVKTGDYNADHVTKHTIPYLIWQNEAYRSVDDFTEKEIPQEASGFSSFYLSAYLFDLIGLDMPDGYFNYLVEMKEKYPIILEDSYMDANRQFHRNEENEDIIRFKNIDYYILFDE